MSVGESVGSNCNGQANGGSAGTSPGNRKDRTLLGNGKDRALLEEGRLGGRIVVLHYFCLEPAVEVQFARPGALDVRTPLTTPLP